jgi:arginine decarboxylase
VQPKGVDILEIACRIPKNYFVTRGRGQSDITVHAGSYHLALRDAGIEMCNIMTYSSIMPKIATEVKKPALVHGSVMETIMAVQDAGRGKRATAGLIFGWLYDKKTNERSGGFVAEQHGNFSEKKARQLLHDSLGELYTNGYSDKYDLRDIKYVIESFVPSKKFGTAIAAICFTSYVLPEAHAHSVPGV